MPLLLLFPDAVWFVPLPFIDGGDGGGGLFAVLLLLLVALPGGDGGGLGGGGMGGGGKAGGGMGGGDGHTGSVPSVCAVTLPHKPLPARATVFAFAAISAEDRFAGKAPLSELLARLSTTSCERDDQAGGTAPVNELLFSRSCVKLVKALSDAGSKPERLLTDTSLPPSVCCQRHTKSETNSARNTHSFVRFVKLPRLLGSDPFRPCARRELHSAIRTASVRFLCLHQD